MTFNKLRARIALLTIRFEATDNPVQVFLTESEITRPLAASAAAEVNWARGELRQVRLDLDGANTLEWLLDPGSPRDLLELEIRTRTFRAALSATLVELQTLAETIDLYLYGDDYKLVPIREDDTLQGMAERHLGGWQEWRTLLDANPVETPDVAEEDGAVIRVPSAIGGGLRGQ